MDNNGVWNIAGKRAEDYIGVCSTESRTGFTTAVGQSNGASRTMPEAEDRVEDTTP